MNPRDQELTDLNASGMCAAATQMEDGGMTFFLLRGLKVPLRGGTRDMDALLCPGTHSGYHTRLFLAENLAGLAPTTQNWGAFVILGGTWYACSHQGVSAEQPLIQILAGHLRALR